MSQIPKIIHQLWIGDKPPPNRMMDTWKDMNPDFEYIRWNEDMIREKGIKFECKKRIRDMEEINGKADIMRWELLYEYGGVFIDADSYCLRPIDEQIMKAKAFAGWEHEEARPGLVATGTMGFPPKHPLPRAAIDWILENEVNYKKCKQAAWQTCGPGLLTRLYNTGFGSDMTIFPSYYFLPVHCTGKVYNGHGCVYAYQEWGSTKKNYDKMDKVEVPDFLKHNPFNVSVLISSYNTKAKYIKDCLESIKIQRGRINIEVVWINDGSNALNTTLLKRMLDSFKNETRGITVKYYENDGNKGIGYTLNRGVTLCTYDVIIKMDSDDIMLENRIASQLEFMMNNPNIMICGAQIEMFDDQGKVRGNSTHPSITWQEYKNKPNHWFVNHPTVCYRKQAILAVGNYNPELSRMSEDFDLELRMLKRFGMIYNFPNVLLKYRLYDNQVIHNGGTEGRPFWNEKRTEIINNLLKD
jgi:mannosyltransferase OCH1-like enzyme